MYLERFAVHLDRNVATSDEGDEARSWVLSNLVRMRHRPTQEVLRECLGVVDGDSRDQRDDHLSNGTFLVHLERQNLLCGIEVLLHGL